MSNSDANFYNNLRVRLLNHVQAAKLDDQILDLARAVYEPGLEKEAVVLSRSEKERLFQQTLQSVLLNMLAKLEDAK
ncbi:MAG: hypothetical protein JNL09_10610 [Anaerolineales bacterium]|nr:hypothetical protein [Anaerolineales bacterium]